MRHASLDTAPPPIGGANGTAKRALAWLLNTDWPILVMIVLVYSQFPDELRLFNAEPLALIAIAILALRAIVWRERFPETRRTAVLLLLYCAVASASYLWADDQGRAETALVRLSKDAVLFVLISASLDRPVAIRRAAWALIAAGMLMTVVPIVQWLTGNYQHTFWGFGHVDVAHIWGAVDSYRVSGTLTDANSFAQALLPVIVVAFGFVWIERRRVARICATIAMAAATVGVIISYSRAGAVVLVVVAIFLVLAYRPRVKALLILLALAVAASPAIDVGYINRMKTFRQFAPDRKAELLKEPGFHGRVSEVWSGMQMFRDHPLGGVGIGNYAYHYQRYARGLGIDKRNEDREAHSLPVEIAAETGVLGLVAFGLFVAAVFGNLCRAGRRLRRDDSEGAALVNAVGIALLAYLMMSLTLHGGYMRLFWIVAAIAHATLRAFCRTAKADGRSAGDARSLPP